ncbi:hypothetical protein [Halomonas sp.]|uniref:hypothetical protein n=1 Tax=Halomonas sp. TaxID=1486246 RepID=UPI00258077A8|nr:hypothetical protein [Halomonas sp.]MCJ8285854.1 hypothetical protein [Halomonas sp.]NQY70398.1 class I SAM-dependent methyltransferase [Halomonas sp.]
MSHYAQEISRKINQLSADDDEYWAFKGRAKREHCHALLAYPAMMIPEMQGELIDILLEYHPKAQTVFDPFVGSGTVLGESLLRGMNFVGNDINPLAILSCEVKSDYFDIKTLEESLKELRNVITSPCFKYKKHSFKNIDKWFLPEVVESLSKIRSAILLEPRDWCRRFYWLALSETVRKFCNSRSSTYKLHIKAEDSIAVESDPIDFFCDKVKSNIRLKNDLWKSLESKGFVVRGKVSRCVSLFSNDVLKKNSRLDQVADLVVTSPPYGDNGTTVTYGQYSYLQLCWISTEDLRTPFDKSLLATQSSIDTASLGGSKKDWQEKGAMLCSLSKEAECIFRDLKKIGKGGEKRFVAFCYDFYESLISMDLSLKPGGYALLTLGNRSINGKQVPLDKVCKELLEKLGMEEVILFERKIPNKRMATRNNISSTMRAESILIVHKPVVG